MTEKQMDWVEKRAKQDRLLKTGTRKAWDELCVALSHAIGSFNTEYAHGGDVNFGRPYDDHVSIRVAEPGQTERDKTLDLIILNDETGPRIEVQSSLVRGNNQLRFAVHEDGVSISLDGKPISPELCSEMLLAPFLFDRPRTLFQKGLP